MIHEETICFKVDEAVRVVEHALKTRSFDAPKMGQLLHAIRQDAQRMENGLKARKLAMEKAGIEEAYQKTPMLAPDKKNKIAGRDETSKKRKWFEFIVKEKGKVIYENKAHAGLLCIVEKITDIDEDGIMTGTSQKFFFGHDLAVWFAFDQLRQGLEARRLGILTALRKAIEGKAFKNPKDKVKLLKAINI